MEPSHHESSSIVVRHGDRSGTARATCERHAGNLARRRHGTADHKLRKLHDEIAGYDHLDLDDTSISTSGISPIVPVRIRINGRVLLFMSTITTFGAPHDAFTSEVAIEAFHPCDDVTGAALEELSV